MSRQGEHPSDVRARRRRKDARPAELLEAGFAEFAEKGFLATRLEDVAARAGVAKGTIYLYYPSKEALFEAAVRSRIVPLLGEVDEVVETYEGSTPDLFRLVLTAVYRKIADSDVRTLMRIMIAEGDKFPSLLTFYHREFLSKAEGMMRRVVERGIARGEFQPSDATGLPIVVMAPAIMAGIWQMTFARVQPIPLEEFMRAHADLALNGLTKRF